MDPNASDTFPPANPPANPYAAPEARIAEVLATGDVPEKAGRLTRLLAVLVDSLVVVVPAIVLAIALPAYQEYVKRAGGTVSATPGPLLTVLLIAFGVLMLGYVVYQIYWLWKSGQTLGKKVMKIRIVRSDGRRAELWRILLLRYFVPGLFGSIPFVGGVFSLIDPLFIFGEQRRCLHDLIADTIVVTA